MSDPVIVALDYPDASQALALADRSAGKYRGTGKRGLRDEEWPCLPLVVNELNAQFGELGFFLTQLPTGERVHCQPSLG